jgi:hypothetical protein
MPLTSCIMMFCCRSFSKRGARILVKLFQVKVIPSVSNVVLVEKAKLFKEEWFSINAQDMFTLNLYSLRLGQYSVISLSQTIETKPDVKPHHPISSLIQIRSKT